MQTIEYRPSNLQDIISTPRNGEQDPVALAQNILIAPTPLTPEELALATEQGVRYIVSDLPEEGYPQEHMEKPVFIPSGWLESEIVEKKGIVDYQRLVERAEAVKFLHIPGIDSGKVYDYVAKNYPGELEKIRQARMTGAESHDKFGTWANVGLGHILSVFAIEHGLMLAARTPKHKLKEADSYAILHDEDKRASKERGNQMRAKAKNSTNEIDRQNAASFRDLAITAWEMQAEPPYNATSVDMRNYKQWGAIECALRIGDSFTGQHDKGGWKADGPVDPALRLQQLNERANTRQVAEGGEFWWEQNHSQQVGNMLYEGRDMYTHIIPEVTKYSLEKMSEIIRRRNPQLIEKYGTVVPENLISIALQEFKEELERKNRIMNIAEMVRDTVKRKFAA